MRRENRKNNSQSKSLTDKIILYGGIGIAVLTVIVFAVFLYSKNLSDDMKNGTINFEKMTNLTNNSQDVANNNENQIPEDASNSAEKQKNELNVTNVGSTSTTTDTNNVNNNNDKNATNNSRIGESNTSNATTVSAKNTGNNLNSSNEASTSASNKANTTNTNSTTNIKSPENQIQESATVQTSVEQEKNSQKELKFQKPVEGEIVREYAKENLIFSETLQEWTTHMGIDIKSEKTTVVNSAEEGTIKSIKNDPRYGLTIVIEHANGFQTVYSNLLTSEFVVEGEKVQKGQAIGTVGNTGVFEIVDEPHLHFEIIKDSLPVDPSLYL